MAAKTFLFFDEIIDDLQKQAPPVVYKYRTWSDSHHKNLLRDKTAWFSHPFDLNDPLDVRPDTVFDLSEVNDQRYFTKLLASAAERFYYLSSQEQRKRAEVQRETTKQNPAHIVETHKRIQASREGHNPYGVFSTGTNPLSEKLWHDYAENYTGYCIGFHTVEFCSQVQSSFGLVNYCDDPIEYSFLNPNDGIEVLYRKKTIWADEEEFRFVTAGIGIYTIRAQKFSQSAVAEIILGHNMPADHEKEIRDIMSQDFPGLPVYKTKLEKGTLTKH